jgi:uncharacterized protein (DUF433 family)
MARWREQMLNAYPQLSADDMKAALKFAAEAVNNTDFISHTASAASERAVQGR